MKKIRSSVRQSYEIEDKDSSQETVQNDAIYNKTLHTRDEYVANISLTGSETERNIHAASLGETWSSDIMGLLSGFKIQASGFPGNF